MKELALMKEDEGKRSNGCDCCCSAEKKREFREREDDPSKNMNLYPVLRINILVQRSFDEE